MPSRTAGVRKPHGFPYTNRITHRLVWLMILRGSPCAMGAYEVYRTPQFIVFRAQVLEHSTRIAGVEPDALAVVLAGLALDRDRSQ